MGRVLRLSQASSPIGEINRIRILRDIRNHAPISRSKLAVSLHLSKASVTEHVNALLEQGLITERAADIDTYAASPGRRPVSLYFNTRCRYVLAVDLRRDEGLVALADLGEHIVDEEPVAFSSQINHSERLSLIRSAIAALLNRAALTTEAVAALAICAPGYWDPSRNTFYSDGIYSDWQLSELRQDLARAYDFAVYLENDVNAAAIGEYRQSGGHNPNMIYLEAGWGLGVGLILRHELYTGTTGRAGEVSHWIQQSSATLPSDALFHGENSSVSRWAFLQDASSLTHFIADIRRDAPNAVLNKLGLASFEREQLDFNALRSLFQAGDPYILDRLMTAAESLGALACNMMTLLDCRELVLSGAWLEFRPLIPTVMQKMAARYIGPDAVIREEALGTHARIYGLLALSWKLVESSLISPKNRNKKNPIG